MHSHIKQKLIIGIEFLIIGFVLGYQIYESSQLETRIKQFLSLGPRFTAFDGQELCERIKILEENSIEFKNNNHSPLPCSYQTRK